MKQFKNLDTLFFAVVLIFLAMFVFNNVRADEIKWFDGTYVFAGLEVTNGQSQFCYDEPLTKYANDNKLTSNIGIYQNIVSKGRFSAQARFTHHSCAVNYDMPQYNAVGIILEYRLF